MKNPTIERFLVITAIIMLLLVISCFMIGIFFALAYAMGEAPHAVAAVLMTTLTMCALRDLV